MEHFKLFGEIQGRPARMLDLTDIIRRDIKCLRYQGDKARDTYDNREWVHLSIVVGLCMARNKCIFSDKSQPLEHPQWQSKYLVAICTNPILQTTSPHKLLEKVFHEGNNRNDRTNNLESWLENQEGSQFLIVVTLSLNDPCS